MTTKESCCVLFDKRSKLFSPGKMAPVVFVVVQGTRILRQFAGTAQMVSRTSSFAMLKACITSNNLPRRME